MKTALLCLVLVCATTTAHAEDVEPAAVTEPYTGRIVLVDVGAGALGVGGGFITLVAAFGGSDGGVVVGASIFLTGVVTYAFGPSLVHINRGQPRRGLHSALARVGMPVVTGALAYTLSDAKHDAIGPGLAIGMGIAMFADWFVLARYPATRPYVTPTPMGGAQVGVAISF